MNRLTPYLASNESRLEAMLEAAAAAHEETKRELTAWQAFATFTLISLALALCGLIVAATRN